MSDLSKFLEHSKNQRGLKAIIKKRLFPGIMSGFEAINRDMEHIEAELAENSRELQSRLDMAEQEINALKGELAELREDVDTRFDACAGTDGLLRNDVENISVNLRNNNSIIERLESDCEFLKLKISSLERNGVSAPESREVVQTAPAVQTSDDYSCIDYFDFENHFRGSIDSIKKAQGYYLKYFSDKKNVVDIGCGRGEFLSLMKDNGIPARGVDIYQPYVDYCNMKGYEAVCGDGAEYLSKLDSVDGIFVGQVAEHLEISRIMDLCCTAYEKLVPGGCIVLETPNPTSLSIYTNAFYIDPSHTKPVHPLTMKYYLEKAGFRNIEIIYTESSRPPYEIPPLEAEGANIGEFNSVMKRVSDMIFGSQDYAAVAVK